MKKINKIFKIAAIIGILLFCNWTIISLNTINENLNSILNEEQNIITNINIPDFEIEEYLQNYVIDLRSIPESIIELENNITEVYIFSSQELQSTLSNFYNNRNSFDLYQNNVRIDVKLSFMDILSRNIWRVQWEEITSSNNEIVEIKTMAGVFTFCTLDTKNTENNPDSFNILEMYISEKI